LATKENSKGMAEQLTHPTRSEMPGVSSPDFLDIITIHQLSNHGFDAIAHIRQSGPEQFVSQVEGLLQLSVPEAVTK
jgi:hypothetical protein